MLAGVFAFQCAVTVGATVLALDKRPISASLRPLDIDIYVFGSQSCATRLVFEGSAPLLGHRLRRLRFASGDTPFHAALDHSPRFLITC